MLVPRPALAWLETAIQSDDVTIEVDRAGRAVVTHQLIMKVRGGPLRSYRIEGVDADAEPLPDGVVSPARPGSRATAAIPLKLAVGADGGLVIDIDHPRGIRRGTFLFEFKYVTDLSSGDRIRREGGSVELSWVGPRFQDGIDSARVVFRLPAAPNPPQLPEVAEDPAGVNIGEELGGVFLSNLRRGHDSDELEVVRPHVAKGEPVVWRIVADPKAFEAFQVVDEPVAFEPPPAERGASPRQRAVLAAIGLVIALLYALLVMLKARLVRRASELRGAEARALVPLPTPLRAALAGAALAGSVAIGALTGHPTAAGLVLVLAVVLAAHRSPRIGQTMRGPGRWLPLSDDEALERSATDAPALPGRFLDVGAPSGFVLLALLVAGFAHAAHRVMQLSPYHGLMLGIGAAALLPIFCTGRARELPCDPVAAPRKTLRWLAKKLRKDAGLRVVAWARIPDGQRDPDELRLKLMPRHATSGLRGIEVGLEYHQGAGGFVALPCVLVRAVDGSASYEALPRSVVWTRGRSAEERVASIRPKLPTRAMCLRLVRRLARLLTAPPRRESKRPAAVRRSQRPTSAAIAAGRGSSTANPPTVSSPSHAM